MSSCNIGLLKSGMWRGRHQAVAEEVRLVYEVVVTVGGHMSLVRQVQTDAFHTFGITISSISKHMNNTTLSDAGAAYGIDVCVFSSLCVHAPSAPTLHVLSGATRPWRMSVCRDRGMHIRIFLAGFWSTSLGSQGVLGPKNSTWAYHFTDIDGANGAL